MTPESEADRLFEKLAAIEHERWSHWQRYLHSKGTRQKDGSLLLPATLVKKWEQQMATSYSSLSDEEKDSDREQVRRYFHLLKITPSDSPLVSETTL